MGVVFLCLSHLKRFMLFVSSLSGSTLEPGECPWGCFRWGWVHSGGISISLNEGTRISMGLDPMCISFPLSMETPRLRDSEIVPSKWWPKLKKEVLPLRKNACACGFTHVVREFNEEPKVHFLVQNHHLFFRFLDTGSCPHAFVKYWAFGFPTPSFSLPLTILWALFIFFYFLLRYISYLWKRLCIYVYLPKLWILTLNTKHAQM